VHRRLSALALILVAASAWPYGQGNARYEATIRRTAYGIPHVTARDMGSLGFGDGYAFAQDHLCSLADQVVAARGERARYFGAGERDAHLNSDIAVKAMRVAEEAAEGLKRLPAAAREQLEGYAAGYNAYLTEVGVDRVAGWCRGAPWVRTISAADVLARTRLVTLTLMQSRALIATAAPPGVGSVVQPQVDLPDASAALSNGWAIGRDRSETRRGALLANPHYPWVGSNRFWEKHLTIPGQLDVYGVSLLGSPGVAIGFNRHVAWTHTVSAGARVTGYALKLVPGSPTSYLYDGQPRRMTTREVELDVRQADGSMNRVSRTVYFSHHGPIVNFPGLPWTATRAVAMRDANAENNEGLETYQQLARAATLDDVKRAHARGGAAFVNTIVATADGRAFYIDASAAPLLSPAALEWWQKQIEVEGDVKAANERNLMLLDGSDSRFEWGQDPRARDPGIVPAQLAPQVERRDYVFNANDSYWMSHARVPLTGYSPVHGPERVAQSLRTRMNARLLDDASPSGPAGADGRFSLDEIWTAAFSNRALSANLLKDGVVQGCQPHGDLAAACGILASWDGVFDLDSRGAVLWREFVGQLRAIDTARVFATPFDPADPIGTPRGFAGTGAAKDPVFEALRAAVKALAAANLALDVRLGYVQFADRGGRRIPLHGGLGDAEGIVNFVNYAANTTTLEPDAPVSPLVPGSRTLRQNGYPINRGSSFVMAVTFTDAGPRGRAILTYGESGDPASPHFADQTELFSRKGWREILFTDEQIRGDRSSTVKVVTGPRQR